MSFSGGNNMQQFDMAAFQAFQAFQAMQNQQNQPNQPNQQNQQNQQNQHNQQNQQQSVCIVMQCACETLLPNGDSVPMYFCFGKKWQEACVL